MKLVMTAAAAISGEVITASNDGMYTSGEKSTLKVSLVNIFIS